MSQTLRFVVFFSVLMLFWGGVHVYLYRRISHYLEPSRLTAWLLMLFLTLLALTYPVGRLLATYWDRAAAAPVILAGALWMGTCSLLFTVLLIVDLGWVLRWFAGRIQKWAPEPVDRSKRRMMLAGISSVALGGAAWGVHQARGRPMISRIEVPFRALSPGLDGLRIVQLSDLHLGTLVGTELLGRAIEESNKLKPDIVLITGDLIDEPVETLGDSLDLLAGLKARIGVFACAGNHELYAGLDGFLKEMKKRRIPVLRQSHIVLPQGLVLAGVDDPRILKGKTIEQSHKDALKGAPKTLPTILLSHRPLRFEHAVDCGVDIMLSGHTHGGQLPPVHLFSRFAHRYMRGMHTYKGGVLYVSRGTGTWGPPMRVLAPPEILLLTLKQATNKRQAS